MNTFKDKAPAVVGIACLARDLWRDPVVLTRRWFKCPICRFRRPFTSDYRASRRRCARCPGCGGTERHRLQYMVLEQLRARYPFKQMRALHFAPESVFRGRFRVWFGAYETADINDAGDVAHRVVDRVLDIRDMSAIHDGSVDFLMASHVLEHVKEDEQAISEVARVLSPGGIAILPVPLVAEKTIEYPCPVPTEFHHVRAPGRDYFERYRRHFTRVEIHTVVGRPDHVPEREMSLSDADARQAASRRRAGVREMRGELWQHLIVVAPVAIVTLVLLLPRLGEIFRRREDERLDPELIERAREKRRASERR